MRIGVNAFPLRAEGGGAPYVFSGLMSALLKLHGGHHYIIFAHLEALRLIHQIVKSGGPTLGNSGPDPRVKVIHISDEREICEHRHEFDLLFGPLNNLNPRLYDRPSVAILHDIQEQYFPDNFNKADLIARMEVYPEICRSATIVVAISQFCKETFVEKFGIDPAKIEIVPNAPQAGLIDPPIDGIWTHAELPRQYLFYPANCYRHKNHRLLLDMVEQFRNEGLRLPVIFSGFELPGGFPLRREIASRGLDDLCQVFTDLPVEPLRYLYRHALAVVFPTKFEGFGMPAIEAAACGCPVVCSDIRVLHEILENNALYFDPDSLGDICHKVRTIIDDAPLRERLIEKGKSLASIYTWERSARRMLEIFHAADERFVWGRHQPNSIRRPRIGVSLRLTHGGMHIARTVKSLLCTGYGELSMRCDVACDASPQLRKFLASAGVSVSDGIGSINGNGHGSSRRDGYAPLQKFAREENLDLVGEIIEGSLVKSTGLDSVAWAHLQEPQVPLHLGEAMEWNGEQFAGVARLRLTGDGLWKMEGYLYPELMFINPRALEAWPEGLSKALQGGPNEWRWELLRQARRDGRLFMSRRTLADIDQLISSPKGSRIAVTAGMFRYYQVESERRVKVRLLRRMEPVVKRAARVLPMKWQDAGTRLWYHLAR